MFAVIKTGGKQYLVQPGDKIKVEKLEGEAGQEVVLPEVLLHGEGENAKIGAPLLQGSSVTAKIVRHGKGDKIIVFKYKPKKRYRRKIGHRQPFTEIEIVKV